MHRTEEIEMHPHTAAGLTADRIDAEFPAMHLSGLIKSMRRWLQGAVGHPRGDDISQAVDHVDLESRTRAWDENRRVEAHLFCVGIWF
jgi:hypothetical protein